MKRLGMADPFMVKSRFTTSYLTLKRLTSITKQMPLLLEKNRSPDLIFIALSNRSPSFGDEVDGDNGQPDHDDQ